MHSAAPFISNAGHFNDDKHLKIFNALSITVERSIIWISKLAGTLGLMILTPFLYIFILLFAAVLMHLNKHLKSHIRKIYNYINDAPDNELIKIHLEIERANKLLSTRMKSLGSIDGTLVRPVMNQIKKLNSQITNLESTLYKAAYPEIHKIPTAEQKNRLLKTFSDIEDWDDSDLDIYEQTYLK
jgi:hypothetical protein